MTSRNTRGSGPTTRSDEGDLVAFAAGAVAGGYVAEVGRTLPVGDGGATRELFERSNVLYDKMLGAIARERISASCSRPTKRPASRCHRCPWRTGWDWGSIRPSCSESLWAAGEHDRLEPGMVLAITGYVWQQGLGAVFRRDTVHITDRGATS